MKLNTLAQRLRFARAQRGLTQGELARMADTTQDVIQKIENGKSLRPRNIDKIAKVLNVSPAWLQFGAQQIDDLSKDSIDVAMAYQKLPEVQKTMIKASIEALIKTK